MSWSKILAVTAVVVFGFGIATIDSDAIQHPNQMMAAERMFSVGGN